jgi:hypothetical protein
MCHFVPLSSKLSLNSCLVSRFSGVMDGGQIICSNGKTEPGHREPAVVVLDAAIGFAEQA